MGSSLRLMLWLREGLPYANASGLKTSMVGVPQDGYSDLSEAISIEKRYFTSDFAIRS